MADAFTDVESRYREALRDFLDGGGEAALARGYDIGRLMIGEGYGVVELAGVHGRALSSLSAGGDLAVLRARAPASQAARFLAEALAPFEMRLRGFEELNRTLEVRVQERTSELEKAQAMFHQAQKMETVGRLAGGVAHDFNNVLSVILMNAELAGDALKAGAVDVRVNVDEIFHAATRAAQLTRQLLAFSRKQLLQPTTISLNDVVTGLLALLRRLIGENVTLATKLDSAIDTVSADKGQIEQVIMNLVVNARDAMVSGGTITLSTTSRGTDVVLSVQDTGSGIAPEVLEHIFEPFFTTKGEGRGTGLGLATCYGIVRQSGGAIEVHSELGRGARFDVLLPASRDATRPIDSDAVVGVGVAAVGATRARILLVDDDAAVLRATARALAAGGHDVTSAASGDEALALVSTGACFDLLVTDVAMPGMGGRELAERVARAGPGLPVLFTSGYSDDEVLAHGVRTEDIDFLEKPARPAELLAKIREILSR
jgi:signal transduction histidine kinase